MKKLISLLAALSVVATGTVAFATDFEVDYDTTDGVAGTTMTATDVETLATYEKDTTTGLYTVDLATVAGDQEQTTILAVEGKTISVGSIKYINQSADKSFSFDMDDPADTVYVLAGGSAINPTLVGTVETASASTGATVSGTVANAPSQSFITDELTAYVEELYGAEAVADYVAQYTITASLIAEDEFENFVLTTIGEAEGFTALQTATVSFEDGTYSFEGVEDGTYAVALTADGAMTWVDYVTVAGENVTVDSVTLIYGDLIVSKDAMIDAVDVTQIVSNMCDIESESFNGTFDVTPDCMIDAVDVTNVVANMSDIYAYDTAFINDNF